MEVVANVSRHAQAGDPSGVPQLHHHSVGAKMSTLTVRLNRVSDEAEDIKSFEFVTVDPHTNLPEFSAGAHVDVRAAPGLIRQYSICNSPADRDRYVVAVKLERNGRGGSRAMHDLCAGALVQIGMPRNNFPLDMSARHHVLIAGGIGLTPLLGMARHLSALNESFELHCCTRSPDHTAFYHDLSSEPLSRHVRFCFAADAARLEEVLGPGLRHHNAGTHLYVCGPTPFMDLITRMAAAWPTESVHLERFVVAQPADASPGEVFTVRLARSRRSFQIPAESTIVETLRENGIDVATSCEQGVCGTCQTAVSEGVPDHRDCYLSAAEKASGRTIMTCVSRAKTQELVLDL